MPISDHFDRDLTKLEIIILRFWTDLFNTPKTIIRLWPLICKRLIMNLNKQKILGFFRKSESRATAILNDKTKSGNVIKEALGKAVTNKGALEGAWTKIILLFAVSKDYINGTYTEIPKRSIIAVLGGLIYFLSPIDVIPDFIPVVGFIDDIFVFNLVYRQVLKDLEKYKAWKDNQDKLILNVHE